MSLQALGQATSLLGALSGPELEQLGAKVAALRAIGPAAPSPRGAAGAAFDEAFGGLLYQAVTACLAEITLGDYPPLTVFARTRHGRAFEKAAAAAHASHKRWFPGATRAQTAALCRIYARALLSYLQAKRKPLHWPVLVAWLSNLPEVFDHAFPGYVQAGAMSMLPVLLKEHRPKIDNNLVVAFEAER